MGGSVDDDAVLSVCDRHAQEFTPPVDGACKVRVGLARAL